MALKFYNQLSKTLELFVPLRSGEVSFYACGPTVYDFSHLGNWRTFVFDDLLRRVLVYTGYQVRQVMNLTDLDDKIINRSAAENISLKVLTDRYTKQFFADLKKLNIWPAAEYPRATDHLPEMITLIEKLLVRGLAYQLDGSVYFAINKFKNYGRLTGFSPAGIKTATQVETDEYTKEDPRDFVLWKAARPGEPAYNSPFGPGRPGWHIECSAMSLRYLGESFDLHTGGVDLIFPHHENEIAQSEGATGKPFVKYWLESEHLLINGQKMSKSLGNIYTLETLKGKKLPPLALRYLFLTAHYRKILNFTWGSLQAAVSALSRLTNQYLDLPANGEISDQEQKKFQAAIEDDLNLPEALAGVWKMLANQDLNPADKKATLLDFDRVLGLGFSEMKSKLVPAEIERLIQEREKARMANDWTTADQLRDQIRSLGYNVDDTSAGPNPHLTH